MYKLKDSTIERLRELHAERLNTSRVFWAGTNRPRDVLTKPLWAYYDKVNYSRRTDKWSTYAGNWSTDERGVYYAPDWPAWRDIGDAHEIQGSGIQHSGWYAAHYYDELICGRVLQLPARNGKPVYVAGVYETDSDGAILWPLDHYETPEEAARAADHHAERRAEESREYRAKDAAEQAVEYHHENAREAIEQFRELKQEVRGKGYGNAVCSVLRDRLKELRRSVSDDMRHAKELRGDFWRVIE